jgi:multicomponent Na+:H+ antiporter subunit F
MLLALCLGLIFSMALLFYRLARGPTIYDRALAATSLSTKTILLIAAVSYFQNRTQWLDIALVYALIGFVGIVALVKFLQYRALHTPLSRHPQDPAPVVELEEG